MKILSDKKLLVLQNDKLKYSGGKKDGITSYFTKKRY